MKIIHFNRILLLFILIIISNCSYQKVNKSPFSSEEKLAHQIDLQICDPDLETAFIGIMVQSVESGEILYEHNSKKMMLPASNEKILTSAAALINFGPDFRYETKVYAMGSVTDSVLNGNLIIVGSGDPTIGYRLCVDEDSCLFFKSWADALRRHGILKINGNLIGIDDIFDDELIGYGWPLEDLSYHYAAQINGLCLHENYTTLNITADSVTNQVHIKVFPDYQYLNIQSHIMVTKNKKDETDISLQRLEGTNDVIISGTILSGKTHSESVTVHNPTLYFLRGLRHELAKANISITGNEIDADQIADSLQLGNATLIHTHYSAPFSEVLTILMKESQNLYAESMVKLVGAHFGNEGTFNEGARILKRTLRRFGLEDNSYVYRDGSGLCHYNFVSPYQIVKVLRGMYYHKYGDVFKSTLPIAGIDGTIDYRLKGTVAQGKTIAKTGTISNVRCLSGYVTTKDKEALAFSIMVNNFICDVNVVMDLQDRICMLLSSFRRKLD